MDAWLCLRRLYGDESELHFWTVAAHYLHSWSQEKSASTPVAQEAAPRDRASNPLDICYDVLCENAYFQVPWRIPTQTALSAVSRWLTCLSASFLGKLWN